MPVCTLLEAKDKCDQFLNVDIDRALLWGSDSIASVSFRPWFQGTTDLISEGRRQENVVRPTQEVKLQWRGSQIAFTIALTNLFSQEGISIVPQYTPNPANADPHGQYIN